MIANVDTTLGIRHFLSGRLRQLQELDQVICQGFGGASVQDGGPLLEGRR